MNEERQALKRIKLTNLFEYLLNTVNLERGLLYSIRELLLRPGRSIREYLFEDRTKLTKPFKLLILIVSVATFLTLQITPKEGQTNFIEGIESGYFQANEKDKAALDATKKEYRTFLINVTNSIKKYLNLLFMLNIPIMSIATFFIFKQSKFYFAEHLVINSYVYSVLTLMYIATIPIIAIIGQTTLYALILVGLIYTYNTWVYHKVFGGKLFRNIARCIAVFLIAQILGLITVISLLFVYFKFVN